MMMNRFPSQANQGRRHPRRAWTVWLLLSAGAAAAGCQPTAANQEKKPETVEYRNPVEYQVADFAVFTGRTQPVNRVDLRVTQVTGFLDYVCVGKDANLPPADARLPDGVTVRKINEGGDAKKGDVLFVIEQKPFIDALKQAEANLVLQQANLRYTEADYQRNRTLYQSNSVSLDDLQKALAARDTAKANVNAASAAVEIARQNLVYTVVVAPFDGRVGKRMVDRGADILANNTILISIEQTDPLYAYFDVDERTVLRIRNSFPGGVVPSDASQSFPLKLGLASDKPDEFTHDGSLQFGDNRIDPGSGTLRMWGLFENKSGELKSGLFARVRMQLGAPKPALFVPEKALLQLQTTKYVYVANPPEKKDDGTIPDGLGVIAQIPVEVGQRRAGGLIAVESADPKQKITTDSRVVVNGLQLVRPGKEVIAKKQEEKDTKAAADKGPGAEKPAGAR
jgi:RND family efflux transporter MFP subunit